MVLAIFIWALHVLHERRYACLVFLSSGSRQKIVCSELIQLFGAEKSLLIC